MSDIINILAVDDNDFNLVLLKKVLKAEEKVIHTALSGKKAIELLESNPNFSLILMDVQMPEMNGFETVKKIKENELLKNIPVIFITGIYQTEEFINQGYEIGAYDYILKPYDSQLLINKVNVYLTIAKQKKELVKTNRKLKIIGDCNFALLFAEEENELFNAFCEAIVESGGYPLSWIGEVENSIKHDNKKIKIKAHSSTEIEFINSFESDIKLLEQHSCSIVKSINTKTQQIPDDLHLCKLCNNNPENFGFKSLISIPFETGEGKLRILTIYTYDKNIFTTEELQMLEDIKSFLVFAINTINTRVEKKKAQEALHAEKEELSVTLSSIADGVITANIDGNITLANKAAVDILSIKYEELIGKKIFNAFNILDSHNEMILFNPLDWLHQKNEEKLQRKQLTILTEDGTRKIISASSSELKDNIGNFIGIVLVFNDITEKIRTENQLALSQKMESIGQLAAGIAHEINTPLQFVGDNIYFLKQAFTSLNEFLSHLKGITETSSQYDNIEDFASSIQNKANEINFDYFSKEIPSSVEETQRGIDRVNKIIQAMKNFAHPSGKQKSLANINQGIEVTTTISRNEWKYLAELETDLDPKLPFVYCSLDEINQVILNMIINSSHAIAEQKKKSADHKGLISIKTKNLEEYIEIIIEDNGAGIYKEDLPRIFDPFFTTKEIGKGTGQGLAIAHNIIVNKHKGKIFVDSTLGKGTKLSIQLPISQE